MDRRSLLKRPFTTKKGNSTSKEIVAGNNPKTADSPLENKHFNTQLPNMARSMAGLEAYTGVFGEEQAGHLLRRCLFGTRRTEVTEAAERGLQKTIELLFAEQAKPTPPINSQYGDDPNVPIGETWVTAPITQGINGVRRASLQRWWMGLMLNQGISLREKMTLFWHNHFAVEATTVGEAKSGYYYLDLLRTHALGNFKTLAEEITINPAMLRYLNGNQNVRNAPNENYAREVLELFTIGKGALVGGGDYTYYTEEDVVEAAKVLTGWRDRLNTDSGIPTPYFTVNRHTLGSKQFSHRFDNQIIEENGENEYKDLINMIFNKRQVARHISEKLYRWFVYYVIDEAAYANVIEPMADMLIANEFEVAPVLEALLKSEHFFDVINYGVIIKNPIDFLGGVVKNFDMVFPTLEGDNLLTNYKLWAILVGASGQLQMNIMNPPSVAGWIAYYQSPQYYQSWISSVTLPQRIEFVQRMIRTGYARDGFRVVARPLEFVSQIELADDPNELVRELVRILFPKELTDEQYVYLKEVLIPGLPDYEWTIEYNEYLASPDNQALATAIYTKLRTLLETMVALAEYQLS
ncbi:MAG: DUF1800 domain-containing protein [Chitinophagales bacterium]